MMMKLVFPAGDRPQLLLGQGVHRIGSAGEAEVSLPASDDVAPLHCELQVGPQGVQLRVPPGLRVFVNERPVDGLIALRAEDTIGVGGARMRLLPVAAGDGAAAGVAARGEAAVGATMVRPVLPKFVLRGLSGHLFGRTVPLQASVCVGRADDAGLRIPMEGVSRQHARLTPAGDEVLVEDLGSANGTWLNGRRVTRAQAVHGDELRFDTQRFQLLVPGEPLPRAASASGEGVGRGRAWQWALAGVVVVALLVWLLR